MKLLLAIDVDESTSQALLNEAVLWAQRTGATLDLVYAMPGVWGLATVDPVFRRALDQEKRRLTEDDNALLHQLVQNIPANHRGSARVLEGNPLDALTTAAEGYDALLVGTHGRTGVSRFWLGSISEQLVRRAPCPVLILRLLSDPPG